jgi:DNA-binding XRE family transcriptional regulator
MPYPRQELIRCRIAVGLSQEDMARAIGISRNSLIRAEDGQRVKLFTARKMAVHYRKSIPDLFPDLMELEER